MNQKTEKRKYVMQAGAEARNKRRDWSAAKEWTQSLLSSRQSRLVICGILQLLIHTAVSSSVQLSAGGGGGG